MTLSSFILFFLGFIFILSGQLWFFYKINNELLLQNQTILHLARENSRRLQALELETSKLKEGVVDTAVTSDNVTVLGVGLVLLVVAIGFVVLYYRGGGGSNVDVAQVMENSNYNQSKVINEHIVSAKRELGDLTMEIGIKNCENQSGIFECVTKMDIRVCSDIINSSSERSDILHSVTLVDERLASYVQSSSLEQAQVLQNVIKADNHIAEHLLNSSVENATIIEKVIKIDDALTEHLLNSSLEKADSVKLDIIFDIMMNNL